MIHRLQISAARALLEWSRARLSEESGVSHRTIARFESGEGDITVSKLAKLERALSQAGIEFVENGVKLAELAKRL